MGLKMLLIQTSTISLSAAALVILVCEVWKNSRREEIKKCQN